MRYISNTVSKCVHEDFKANVSISRLTDSEDSKPVTGYAADMKAECANCGMKFQWLGDRGISYKAPMVSFDRLELRAPLVPMEED